MVLRVKNSRVKPKIKPVKKGIIGLDYEKRMVRCGQCNKVTKHTPCTECPDCFFWKCTKCGGRCRNGR